VDKPFYFLSARAFERLDRATQETYLLTLQAHVESTVAPRATTEPPELLFPPNFATLTREQKFAYCSQLIAHLRAARRLADN
jgi:hypothetical protein